MFSVRWDFILLYGFVKVKQISGLEGLNPYMTELCLRHATYALMACKHSAQYEPLTSYDVSICLATERSQQLP